MLGRLLLWTRVLLCLLLIGSRVADAAEAFAVEFEAPDNLRELLGQHVELSRWQSHERMTAEEFRRLYRAAPKEIADLLATQGYYRPKVESTFDEQGDKLLARFIVAPGDPVNVTSTTIQFTGALTSDDRDAERKAQRLRSAWPLAVGEVFRHEQWEEGKRALLRSLALDRYPLAVIAKSEAVVDPDAGSVRLMVLVDSGPAARFGGLIIEGLKRYPRSVVENLNPVRPGEPYSILQLQEYQTRLLESGYFTSVTVDAPTEPDGTAAVRVWLQERESRRIAFGIGYSTDTGNRVQAEYRLLNFMERGLQLGGRIKLESRASSAGADLYFPTNPQGHRYRITSEAENKQIQGTETDKIVFTLGRSRRRGDIETDVSVSYIAEEERVADMGRDSRMAVTGNWSYTIRRTDHPLFPQDGYLFNFQVGGAPGVLVAERSFLRLYGRLVHYTKWGDSGVLSLRGELGTTLAKATNDVPSDYLFRTGGDQTVRGYAYQSLGVRQGAAVTGGRALAIASAEYTRWVNEDWGVAVFLDVGNAADNFTGFEFVKGVGVGARWRSPVGPLNLDIAHGIDEGRFRLHFSVGLAF